MAEEANTNPTPAAAPQTPPAGDDGRTYTAEYVRALREEAKNHRLRAVGTEKAVRAVLGLKDDEELGDIAQRITAKSAAALKSANDRMIAAELKGLEGYDHRLLSKVIDLSGVKIDDQGGITGVKEAAEAAAKEFPAVKSAAARQSYIPPNPGTAVGGAGGTNQAMNALIRGKR